MRYTEKGSRRISFTFLRLVPAESVHRNCYELKDAAGAESAIVTYKVAFSRELPPTLLLGGVLYKLESLTVSKCDALVLSPEILC